jgi:hypothetical protein
MVGLLDGARRGKAPLPVGTATPGTSPESMGRRRRNKRASEVNICATWHHSTSGQYSMPIDMRFCARTNIPQNAMKVQATGERWLYLSTLR